MSSSPMTAAKLHDTFVLLDGGKRIVVPGACMVKAGMVSNLDAIQSPGDGQTAAQLYESTGEVEVHVTMWTKEQWDAYQGVLWRLRQGKKAGMAVFGCAHPEVTARKIKRLYFIEEKSDGYSPKGPGYRVTLTFREKLKDNAKTEDVGDTGAIEIPGQGGTTASGGKAPGTASGQASFESAMRNLTAPPAPLAGGKTTASPGYCSAWDRVSATQAGLSPSLYGSSAIATEAAWKRAGMSVPWNADSQRNLQNGDKVFWGNDPSGFGHVGTVVGRDSDGMPLIAGNNLVTYKQRGGRFDAGGRPIDQGIDSRGIVRLDQLSTRTSQPTSVGKPGGVPTGPKFQGPAAPVIPQNAPSRSIPGPGK